MKKQIYTLILLAAFISFNTEAQTDLCHSIWSTSWGGGGNNGIGTIFKMRTDGSGYDHAYDYTTNYPGASPVYAQLCQAPDGKLYGMTQLGGADYVGVLFSFDPSSNTYTRLLDFNGAANGANPYGSLIVGGNGILYGMTSAGGTNDDGVIFSFDPSSDTYTKLLDFNGYSNGANPYGSLALSNGVLYGMTSAGGLNDEGVLFGFNLASGTYTKLMDFNGANGNDPQGSLALDANGKLYGMTGAGGENNDGVLFSFDPSSNIYARLFNFSNASKGSKPYGTVVMAADGTFYGVTYDGGANNDGVLFNFNPSSNTYSKLFDFSDADGGHLMGSLLLASDGLVYGVAADGGQNGVGVLFSFDPSSDVYKKLRDFNGSDMGTHPCGSLMQASDGKLYGVTYAGGVSTDGVIFSYDPAWHSFNKLVDFNLDNSGSGIYPTGDLAHGNDGYLYGMTFAGGARGNGVIFSLDPNSNTYTKRFDFSGTDGAFPWLGHNCLMQASDGKMYGTTAYGGANFNYSGMGDGVLFSFDPASNNYTKLFDFDDSANGSIPFGTLMQASNGKLYGTTAYGGVYNYGVLFSFDPASGTFSKLFDFDSLNGSNPFNKLIEATNGKLYGTVSDGGVNNAGVFFSFDPSSNTFKKLLDFDDASSGANPYGDLVVADHGKLFGITGYGGLNHLGVIFSLDPASDTFSKLFDFDGTNGDHPEGGLMQALDDYLYGTSLYGGMYDEGVVFKFDPATGTYIKLLDLSSPDGIYPEAEFIEVAPLSASLPTISGSANPVCIGSNTTLSIADGRLNSATDWKWYAGNCGSNYVGSGTSITVSPAATTVYSVRGEGDCVVAGHCAQITVTVNPLPAISNITGSASVCVNSTIQLSDSTAGGRWRSTDRYTAIIDESGIVTGISGGTALIRYVGPLDSNRCYNVATETITVNPLPYIAPISGDDAVCLGSTIQLTDATPGGSWNNGDSVIDAISTQANSSLAFTGKAPGTDAITYTVVGPLCTNVVSLPITVSSPAATMDESATFGCQGSTNPPLIIFTGTLGIAPYTFNYTLNGVSMQAVTTSGSTVSVAVPVTSTGVFTYVLTSVSDNIGCSNPAKGKFAISIYPTPDVSASPSDAQTICSGASMTPVSFSNPNATPGTYLRWTRSNTDSVTSTISTRANPISGMIYNLTNVQQPTVFTITATAGACSSTTSVTVNVNPIPSLRVTSTKTQLICSGGAITPVTIVNGNNVDGTTFSWSRDNGDNLSGITAFGTGATISGILTNTSNPQTTQNTIFTIQATSPAGCYSTVQRPIIIVNPRPDVLASPSDLQTLCSGDSITPITITNPNGAPGTSLTWNRSNRVLLQGLTVKTNPISGTLVNTTNVQQTVVFTVVAVSGSCASAMNVTVNVNPKPSLSVNSIKPQAICSGSAIKTVNIANSNNVAGTTLTWIRDNTDNVAGIDVSGSGTSISGSLTNLSDPPTPQTTSFIIQATSPDGCYSVAHAPTITVNPIPDVLATPADQQTICSGDTIIPISISNPNGVDGTVLSWIRTTANLLPGLTPNSNPIAGNLTNTTNLQQTSVFTIKAATSTCFSTTNVLISVNPVPTLSLVGSLAQSICSGSAMKAMYAYNANNVAGTTYSWTRDNTDNLTGIDASGTGAALRGNLTNVSNPLTPQSTTFTIQAISPAGCYSSFMQTAPVTVNPLPDVLATPSDVQTLCSGDAMTPITIINPNSVDGTTITWSRGNTRNVAGITANSNPIEGTLTNTTNFEQATVFAIKATAGLCSSTTSVTVNVNPMPTASLTNMMPQAICSGSAIRSLYIINTNNIAGTTFSWTRDNTDNVSGINSSGSGAVVSGSLANNSDPYTPQNTTFTVQATSPLGCSSFFQTPAVTVNPIPDVLATPSDVQTICSGTAMTPVSISNPNALDGTSITWTRTNSVNITGITADNSNPIQGTLTNTRASVQSTAFIIIATAGSCSSTTSVLVQVTPTSACRTSDPTAEAQSTGGSEIPDIRYYPNPAHDKLNVDFNAVSGGEYSMKMIDITGRFVIDKITNAEQGQNHFEIDLGGLSKGIYLLSFASGELNKQVRVVVE